MKAHIEDKIKNNLKTTLSQIESNGAIEIPLERGRVARIEIYAVEGVSFIKLKKQKKKIRTLRDVVNKKIDLIENKPFNRAEIYDR